MAKDSIRPVLRYVVTLNLFFSPRRGELIYQVFQVDLILGCELVFPLHFYLFNISYCSRHICFRVSLTFLQLYNAYIPIHTSTAGYCDDFTIFEKGCAMWAVLCLEGDGFGLFLAKGMNKSKDADKINAGCILCELECSRLSLVLCVTLLSLLLHFFFAGGYQCFFFLLLLSFSPFLFSLTLVTYLFNPSCYFHLY